MRKHYQTFNRIPFHLKMLFLISLLFLVGLLQRVLVLFLFDSSPLAEKIQRKIWVALDQDLLDQPEVRQGIEEYKRGDLVER